MSRNDVAFSGNGSQVSAVSLTAFDARQIDNVFTRPLLSQRSFFVSSDGASSSDLDIGGLGTDRHCFGDKHDERSEQVHLQSTD